MLKSSYLASLLAVASALYTLGCKNEVEAVVPDGTSSGSGGSVGSGAGGSTGSAACDTVIADASTTPTVVLQGKAGTIAVDDCWLFLGGADSPVPYRVSKAGGDARRDGRLLNVATGDELRCSGSPSRSAPRYFFAAGKQIAGVLCAVQYAGSVGAVIVSTVACEARRALCGSPASGPSAQPLPSAV